MRASLVFVTLVSSWLLLPISTQAQTPLRTPDPSSPKGVCGLPPTAAAQTRLRVWRDFSTSMDERELERLQPSVLTVVKSCSFVLAGVEVVRFGVASARTWTQPVVSFDWNPAPRVEPFVAPQRDELPLYARIFKVAAIHRVAHASSEYKQALDEATRKYDEQVDFQLARFQEYLAERPNRSAPCTRFTDLAVRIVDEDRPLNLIVTDGWNDCGDRVKIDKEMEGELLIVLLPRERDLPGASENDIFNKRQKEMLELFPKANVVRPHALRSALQELLWRKSQ